MSTELMLTMKGEITQSNIYDLYTNTLSPLTKTNYVSTIKDFFGVDDLSKITIDDIQMVNVDVVNLWARTRLLNGNSKSTINRKLSAMSNFYDFLCRRGIQIMTYNPFSTKQGAIRFKNTKLCCYCSNRLFLFCYITESHRYTSVFNTFILLCF